MSSTALPNALAEAVNQIAAENAAQGAPPPSSTTPPSFQDIDGFVTAAELSAAAAEPSKLQELLSKRWEEKGRIGSLLRQKAEYLDMIRNNPAMVEAITNIIEGKPANGAPPAKLAQSDEIAALRQEIVALKGGLQQRDRIQEEVRQFAAQNPDFVRLIPTMQQIQQERPHLQIKDLYEIAKARQSPSGAPTNSPPASERPTAGFAPDRTSNPQLTKLQAELRDRTIPFDTALERAVQFAMQG